MFLYIGKIYLNFFRIFLYKLKLYLLYKILRCINICEGKELFFNMQYFLNVLHINKNDSFYIFAIPGAEHDEQKNIT